MDRQAAAAGERLPALVAGVRTLTCVRPQMGCEAAALAERLPADAAAERPQPLVHALLVHVEAAARGEAAEARGTPEGFVLQVDSQVRAQVAVFGELSSAVRTPEAPLRLRTTESVLRQAAPRHQRIAAGRTAAAPPTGCLVCPQVAARAEHLAAVSAAVRPVLCVHRQLVNAQAAAGGERLAAGGAGEGPPPAVDLQVSAQVAPPGKAAAADAAGEAPPSLCCRASF